MWITIKLLGKHPYSKKQFFFYKFEILPSDYLTKKLIINPKDQLLKKAQNLQQSDRVENEDKGL